MVFSSYKEFAQFAKFWFDVDVQIIRGERYRFTADDGNNLDRFQDFMSQNKIQVCSEEAPKESMST